MSNSNNISNNALKGVGVTSPFANSGAPPQSTPISRQRQLLSSSQPQGQGGLPFPGHFRLSEPQDQVLSQPPTALANHQSQMQSTNHSIAQLQNPSPDNAGGSLPAAPTPATGSSKRSRHKPPSRPSGGGASNANAASQFKTMELTPAPRRKKLKLAEEQIPNKVAAMLPQSTLYTQLLEFEARVDAVMARKKTDVQESLKNPPRAQKTLRVYVFNTFENQGQGDHEKKDSEPPSWSLRIVGRILEDGKDPVLAGTTQKLYPEFSSFFKRITIYLDQSLYPNNHVILWENARSPVLHEGFEVKRRGDKEFTARIRLEMNNTPEKFKLSAPLSEILGIDVESRPRILVAIWQYIKTKKLQNPSDPSFFTCDPRLQKIFGEEKMKFSMVSQKINPHLTPPQPFHVEHRIKLSGNCPSGTTCYDIAVDVPIPLQKDLAAFLANTERQKEIDACDELIRDCMKKIGERHRRRAFFLGFSQSPAQFINALITSQSKDLKLVAGDASRNDEKEHRSDFYNRLWVEDAVVRYLNRKSAGSDAFGSI